MKYLDLTLATPEANLACDEALLDACDQAQLGELIRFWEPAGLFVVVGYANQTAREVNLPLCQARHIPVFRRCTGGGAVVQGPGCLNYSLCLRTDDPQGPLASINGSNRFILAKQQQAFESLLQAPVEVQGFTDLVVQGRKFSGNAQRRKRHHLLFHGSVLLDFDLRHIQELLPLPSKQPDYRLDRSHLDFLTNIRCLAEQVKLALRAAWDAHEELADIPAQAIEDLVRTKYARDEWNCRF